MSRLPVAPGDRNVPWLNACPETWRLKPVKYICSINRRALPETTDPDTEFRYLDISSVDSDGNWIASEPLRFEDAPSRARRVVADGDVRVSTVRTYLRAIAHINKVDDPLICSTGFAVLSANGAVYSKFLAYWSRSVYFVDEVVARSVGVSYPAVNASDVGNIPCPHPSLDEQRAIATFLDRETARIDALIEKKRRQIELLHEKRAALISHAVTKGLDPKAKMRDSGIEWLGEVPAHWEVLQIKRLSIVKRGASPRPIDDPKYFDDQGEFSWVRIADVTASERYLEVTTQRLSSLGKSLSVPLEPGSLFLSIAGSVGKPVITRIRCCIHDGFVYFPLFAGNSEFLYYILVSGQCYGGLGKLGTQLNLNTDIVGEIHVGYPPPEEQREIELFLDQETAGIDALIKKVELSIDRLSEYRTALISAAVTGKIDVREVFA